MQKQIDQIMSLFRGHMGAHGTHGEPYQEPNKSKWEIKKTARTLREPVTTELWEQHLKGERPLGIITITEDNLCYWGSIDIDRYDIDLVELIKKVEKSKFPLVPCRSKSGGLHLFIFLSDPQPAGLVQAILRDMAASLGLAGSEIFPKQTQILTERGDLGSWMVMPYFGGTYGGKLKEQVGLKKTGAEMTLGEFLRVAASASVDADSFQRLGSRKKANGKHIPEGFGDGPPCLEHLAAIGFPEGTRNNSLFHMGVYFRKKNPGGWKAALEAANQEYMRPPLTTDEMAGVIKSLDKKTYEYTCKVEPMCSHCDGQLCRARRFGVGEEGNLPVILSLSKYDTTPPIWFLNVEGIDHVLDLSSEQLQIYTYFHLACISSGNKVFGSMKQAAWLQIVAAAMENVNIIEVAPEIGIEGRFLELLETFLTNRARGESMEDILLDRPWESEEDQCHYFKLSALQTFMQREDMRDDRGIRMGRNKISRLIQKLGGERTHLYIRREQVGVWRVPSELIRKAPSLDVPPVPGVPI